MIPNTHNLESNISAVAIVSLHVTHYAYPETTMLHMRKTIFLNIRWCMCDVYLAK